VNFTVEWEPATRTELHQLWAVSPDPAAVRAARDEAERLLGADPVRNGRHVAEGVWPIHVPPLLVYYTIDTGRQRVLITDVIHTGLTP
jgi:hypothetical protein